MAPFEALYGRRCRSPVHWYETGENLIVAPYFVESTTEAVKLIQKRMKIAQSRQKSYVDRRRRPLEFKVGDSMFLKVAPMKGIMRFRKKENLTYEEQPVQILDRKDKALRNKVIPLVKVLWRNHKVEEATWEREDEMRIKYPHLF
ncbi:hypothetical protein UlMin_019973 [Ulmus minor]